MKKIFLLFAFLLTLGSSMISCRENQKETEVELNSEELNVSDDTTEEDSLTEVPREKGVGEINDDEM